MVQCRITYPESGHLNACCELIQIPVKRAFKGERRLPLNVPLPDITDATLLFPSVRTQLALEDIEISQCIGEIAYRIRTASRMNWL